MTEIELTVKDAIESISDFKDSYTYIEESYLMVKIGFDKEFINIRALSLLNDILHKRISHVIWGDIGAVDGGMCMTLILGHNQNNNAERLK